MTGTVFRGTLYAVLIGVILNIVIFLVGNSIAGPIQGFIDGSGVLKDVPIFNIIALSLIPAFIAGAGVLILSRLTEDYLSWAMWITGIVSLLSLLLPYYFTVNTASFATLGLMHVVVGMAVLYGLINYVWSRLACIE